MIGPADQAVPRTSSLTPSPSFVTPSLMHFFTLIWKNVWRRKVRCALTGLGVALAVAAAVALVSFSSGFEQSSEEVYSGHGIDLVVLRSGVAERLTSSLSEEIAEQLMALPHVRAVNPSLTDMVSLGEGSLIGVPVHGWRESSFIFRDMEFTSGKPFAAGEHGTALLGQSLAKSLKKQVGEQVDIEGKAFRVGGIYRGLNVFEDSTAVVELGDLQLLMDRPGQVTEFQVQLETGPDANATAEALRPQIAALKNPQGDRWGLAAVPTGEYITGSTEIRIVRGMSRVTSLIAVLIGSIGMLNTMVMSVLERTGEIGLLRAIGWRKRRVLGMIMGESLLISLAGSVVGLCGAWLIVNGLSRAPMLQGLVRPELTLLVLSQGFLLALVVGVLGGAYPAWLGASQSPWEALRNE
jgi:putative ABC transport system permease protein